MHKRILTVQDISCVGQCSLTVALPILSACGLETAVLPSAVLSTHTAGFTGFTVRDLSEDIPPIAAHWEKEGLTFDAIYTGYLGSTRQIGYVEKLFTPQSLKIVDPAMADNGKLYPAFDGGYVQAMKGLCRKADYIIPNITEACFLTGESYRTEYDESYIRGLLEKLTDMGCQNMILTGVSFEPGFTGVAVLENGIFTYYRHEKRPRSCHGTGDIYASAFVGALVRGKSAPEAAKIAADFTVAAMDATEPEHWYGARFEPVLGSLIEALL